MLRENHLESMGTNSPDYILLLAVGALLAIGLMMVYSTTFALGYEAYESSSYFLVRQAIWTLLGIVAMLVMMRVDYNRWRGASVWIMGGTLLLLAAVLVMGQEVQGARRWFLGRSIQPSEFAKLALVLYIAHWLSSKGERIKQVSYGLIPFSVLIGLVTGLIILEPDFGTAILMAATAVAMFFIAGADFAQLVSAFLIGGTTLWLVISRTSYAASRITAYLNDPLTDPFSSTSYHVTQTLIALGSGGLTGLGPGSSRQKLGFLPAPHTDTIFAIIGEELGFLGCILVMGLFVVLAYRGLRIALRAPDKYGMFLAAGVTFWLVFQATINIAVVTATLPFTGLPLPLISFGGSSLLTSLAGIGLLLNISRAPAAEERNHAPFDLGWRDGRAHLSRPRHPEKTYD